MKRENTPTSRLKSVFAWLDENLLLFLSGFLLAFIPLYPKLPLADILPGYIVRLRLEDLLIAFTVGVWGIQLLRRKVSVRTPLTFIIAAYFVVGLISSISAIFVTKTVPMSTPHVLKLFLHYFRRVEYLSLFFVTFSAIKTRQQVIKLLGVFVGATLLVACYGFGQKYLYWPVYSTMNREFSKGLRLYLTEHARVQSTFGGHYDFAAFLVMALPLVFALMTYVKKTPQKLLLGATFLSGLWGLMMTSSRSSFLAYFAAMTIVVVLLAFRKGIVWGVSRLVALYLVTTLFLVFFGDLLDRFGQIFKDNSAYTALQASVNQAKEKAATPLVEKPDNGISIDDVNKAIAEAAKKEKVIDKSDTQPSVVNPGTLPPDVFDDIPAQVIATKSAEGKDIEVKIPRIFSENAHRLGLSAAIRLDTLWPFAIRGFLRNPLFGSGYSTLTKYTNDQFTEAESTDNDFLRTLGETGALGFITFYGIMCVAMLKLWTVVRKNKDELLGLLATVLAGMTVGLFINAVYIDVFVSSKVTQVYWILVGVMLAYAMMVRKTAPASKAQHSQKARARGKTTA